LCWCTGTSSLSGHLACIGEPCCWTKTSVCSHGIVRVLCRCCVCYAALHHVTWCNDLRLQRKHVPNVYFADHIHPFGKQTSPSNCASSKVSGCMAYVGTGQWPRFVTHQEVRFTGRMHTTWKNESKRHKKQGSNTAGRYPCTAHAHEAGGHVGRSATQESELTPPTSAHKSPPDPPRAGCSPTRCRTTPPP
jgi:hypothetical protein